MSTKIPFVPAVVASIALLGAGCGNDGGGNAGVASLGLDEARTHSSDTPVAVDGYLLVEHGRTRLCDALAESWPPQCGGPSLRVVSLPPEVPELEETKGGRTRWSERPVQVMGVVSGGEIAIGEFLD